MKGSSHLNKPNQFGVFTSDNVLAIKDFVANDYVALVFELEFKV